MSLKDEAAAWLKTVVTSHLPRTARRYIWSTWTGEVRANALGGTVYLDPAEGKVVDESDRFLLVKTGVNAFCLVLKELLTEVPALGAKVRLEFYQLRRFDGSKADGSDDAAENGCRSFTLTGTRSQFPVKWDGRDLGINERHAAGYRQIMNPYLRDLITQMEAIPADGGIRRSVNILIDAGVTQLEFVDPPEAQSVAVPPAIRFKVGNSRYSGELEISYDRGMDYYRIVASPPAAASPEPADNGQQVFDDVDFEQLAPLLAELIDDGRWAKVKVTVLKPAPKMKVTAVAT